MRLCLCVHAQTSVYFPSCTELHTDTWKVSAEVPSAEVLPELRSLHWVPDAVSVAGDCPQWCITTTAAQS